MKAAIVLEAGRTPVYGDFKEPVPGEDEVRINVSAAALSNVVRSRASGKHYSSSGDLPFVVGSMAWAASMTAAVCTSFFRSRRWGACRKGLW